MNVVAFIFNDFFLSVYVSGHVYVHMCMQYLWKRTLDPLELELQVIVSCQMCVLGNELWSCKYIFFTKKPFLQPYNVF